MTKSSTLLALLIEIVGASAFAQIPGSIGSTNVDASANLAGGDRGELFPPAIPQGHIDTRDKEMSGQASLTRLTRAADAGDANAQWELGVQYCSGTHVERNYGIAYEWFEKAANQGEAHAQFWLAKMLGGQYPGIERDDYKAAYWYQRAANHGNALAEVSLGDIYSTGVGVNRDTSQAVFWWSRAAQNGVAQAQVELASAYFMGYGVPNDFSLAARWYQAAASQGRNDAALVLADMYRTGLGVSVDYGKSASLYLAAANEGFAAAKIRLGELYERGQGVEKDLLLAYAWNYSVIGQQKTYIDRSLEASIQQSGILAASSQGGEIRDTYFQEADANILRITKYLSPEEVEEAKSRATTLQANIR